MGLWYFFDIFITFYFFAVFLYFFVFAWFIGIFEGFVFLLFVLSFIFLRDYWVCLRYVLGTVLVDTLVNCVNQDRPQFRSVPYLALTPMLDLAGPSPFFPCNIWIYCEKNRILYYDFPCKVYCFIIKYKQVKA